MALIELKKVSKRYEECVACSDITFSIEKSTVHSIIGENGAGKSTLVKLLGGLEPPTSGELFLNGTTYQPKSAQDAHKNKIAVIHQHFVLADHLSALDNIILSASSQSFSISFKKTDAIIKKTTELLNKFHWQIPLSKKVFELSIGEQQRLEILKALLQEPDIIIFDEPTAVLTPQESEELLSFILNLKKEGKTIILISHKLNEIKMVSDFISIMRHGQLVGNFLSEDLDTEKMAELMIGRKIIKNNSITRPPNASVSFSFSNRKIEVYKNEIFGVAGVEGNGQTDLIANLINIFKKNKLSYGDITEDRLKLSVFDNMSMAEHVFVRHPIHFLKNGFVDKKNLQQQTTDLLKKWDVRPSEADKPLIELSGGNQQKFIVGRELMNDPDVLLAAHPTRGVDLGAQEKIHDAFLQYSKNEKTVFLVSSDLNEILFLSDRYIILSKNNIYGPFSKNQLSEKQIGLYMMGDHHE